MRDSGRRPRGRGARSPGCSPRAAPGGTPAGSRRRRRRPDRVGCAPVRLRPRRLPLRRTAPTAAPCRERGLRACERAAARPEHLYPPRARAAAARLGRRRAQRRFARELGFRLAPPRFGSEPPALKLRDDGNLLCATLGLPDPDRRDCYRPPLDELESRIMWQPTAAGTVIAGVAPAHVGSVELLLEAGPRLVPTTVDAPYTGRYRGLVRVFSVTVPGRDQPHRVTFNSLDGKPLAFIPIFAAPSFERALRPVFRARSGWRLGAGVVRGGLPCLQLVHGRFSREPLSCILEAWPRRLNVTCRPKAAPDSTRRAAMRAAIPGSLRGGWRRRRGRRGGRIAVAERDRVRETAHPTTVPAPLRRWVTHSDRAPSPPLLPMHLDGTMSAEASLARLPVSPGSHSSDACCVRPVARRARAPGNAGVWPWPLPSPRGGRPTFCVGGSVG
jgi:hypothetical protein